MNTMNTACSIASMAVVDAPLTTTCTVVTGLVAAGADALQGKWGSAALDAASMVPFGKYAALGVRALTAARAGEDLSVFLRIYGLGADGVDLSRLAAKYRDAYYAYVRGSQYAQAVVDGGLYTYGVFTLDGDLYHKASGAGC